ncbi:MAG: acetyl-CoA carboxylase, biotin carboxyl carrier protein, partial [Armatimonadetes bacterium]|nr:acetyl-CoA carboxylase, biotin carboxyl carrier protein [Armatimonadota bacterium]
DEIQVSDTVGLIEAMKLFSEVTSHLHGRIVQFVPEDGQHVEADAPLVLIEPFRFKD